MGGRVAAAAFITAQRAQHGVPTAATCRALGVSPAWYYNWRDGDPSPRRARRAALAAEVAHLFAAHHGSYGSPRIIAKLREAGWRVSETTVAALMREHGLQARPRRRRRHVTRPGKRRGRAPDLAGRRFGAAELNRKWYGDGTEIVTDEASCFWPACWTWAHGGSSVRPVRPPRRRAGVLGAGKGDRGPRRPGGDRPRGAAHRPGQRTHRRHVPRRLQPVRHPPVDGPTRLGGWLNTTAGVIWGLRAGFASADQLWWSVSSSA
jgi:hypothetical protein